MLESSSQKVGPSDCRSLGSNQPQSGRSAKVSIGITVEKSPTVQSGVGKEDAPVQSAEIHSSCIGRVVGNQSRLRREANLEKKRVELEGQKNSNCLPLRSSCCRTSIADASKCYVKQSPVLPSVDSAHRKTDRFAYEHDRERSGDLYVDQGPAFVSMKKTNLLDQEINGEQTVEPYKNTTDGLKMKLWEILGGASSQKEHSMNTMKLESNENIGVDCNQGLQKGGTARPKPSSDPIETDSDSPNQTVRRRATRSMTRKNIPNKTGKKLNGAFNNGKKPLSSACSDFKHKAVENLKGSHNEKVFFSFSREEKRMQNLSAHAKSEADIELRKISGSSSDNNPNVQTNFECNDKEDIFSFDVVVGNKRTVKGTNAQFERPNEKRKAAIEKKTIHLPTLSNSKSSLQKNEMENSFSSAKVLPSMNEVEVSPCTPCPSKKQSMQPKNVLNDGQNSQMKAQNLSSVPLMPEAVTYENNQSSLPEKEKRLWEHVEASPMSKFIFQHDKPTSSRVTSSADASDDLQSPTLAGKTTPIMPSRPPNEIAGSPLQSRKINFTWNFHNSDIVHNDNPISGGSKANTESSDDTREAYESRDLESTFVDGNETKEQLSLSPKTRHDSDSFGADQLKIKGFIQTSKLFPNVDNSDEFPLKLHKRRRVHGPKNAKLNEGDETDDLYEASEQCFEDSLARAVSQLALGLRRIDSKLQLHTNKKCCEILSAVADKIKQQLQHVDSKIHEDMGKFNGASKSKRKHLESQFEEHQGRLSLIHEKYKEEFNHHLLNCSSTLKELEAQNIEIKATADRQKILHRKLLLQLEETMKDQLNAAETSITAIRKDARKKLNSLKFALKEWLSDGAIS
ncbi:meiosis-specific protein PAIR3 isoform X2 [Phalaenopsis equestris]|nr:meiosis-specific protein PAIR3 isoform X2 [Phalaenopsis equestris]XP_020580930.1 meiosis-specific protein PAIR3 isoform X2 [Phalaenopsis equestris]